MASLKYFFWISLGKRHLFGPFPMLIWSNALCSGCLISVLHLLFVLLNSSKMLFNVFLKKCFHNWGALYRNEWMWAIGSTLAKPNLWGKQWRNSWVNHLHSSPGLVLACVGQITIITNFQVKLDILQPVTKSSEGQILPWSIEISAW